MMRKTNISDDASIAIARRLEEIAEDIRCGAVGVLDFREELSATEGFAVEPNRYIVFAISPLRGEQRPPLRFDADGRPRGADAGEVR